MIRRAIDRRFGTHRGLVRLALSYAECLTPDGRRYLAPAFHRVRRVVFVCQGNICRSAYADAYARPSGLPIASCGLMTTSGLPANETALAIAGARGVDLASHRTTRIEDLASVEGDLYVVMEFRQARRLALILKERGLRPGSDTWITLLGRWGRPPRPHIHDPHTLSREYFETCLDVVERSTDGLIERLKRPA